MDKNWNTIIEKNINRNFFVGMGLVSECPGNKTEVYAASKRLNCGNDSYGNNLYICLPNEDKTSLVELCFDGIIGLNEKGMYLSYYIFKYKDSKHKIYNE